VPAHSTNKAARSTGDGWGLVDFTVCDHYGAIAARMHRVVMPADALSELELDERR
jgi:hypothetical protein